MKAWLLLALPLLGACAGNPKDDAQRAALTPLNDLNLVRADVPPVLQSARAAPYALPAQRNCAGAAAEVAALDAVLGVDLDAPAGDRPSLLERGNDAVSDAAGKALKSAAEGVIPFRGWVRKLSGAERYERGVAAAIAAGGVRRAFLKGWTLAQACPKLPVPPATSAP